MIAWKDHVTLPEMRIETHFDGRQFPCFVNRPPSFYAMWEDAVKHRPEHEAISFNGQRWTYAQAAAEVDRIARGFAAHFPILLLDEPTASLDTENRNRVLELVAEAQGQGSAIIAVFHDEQERLRACSRSIELG